HRGSVISSIWRVVGVVLGCLYILVVQLILYDHSSHMLLMMPLIGLGLAFVARLHVMAQVGAGVCFASITTIGIMFGQNMHPDSDLVFSDLYR
ncbi:1,4-alpha-glucan branching protein, partial [Escherichia coli]|nr:1,4-alpha-glucan branching protein [Escherichia coli]